MGKLIRVDFRAKNKLLPRVIEGLSPKEELIESLTQPYIIRLLAVVAVLVLSMMVL